VELISWCSILLYLHWWCTVKHKPNNNTVNNYNYNCNYCIKTLEYSTSYMFRPQFPSGASRIVATWFRFLSNIHYTKKDWSSVCWYVSPARGHDMSEWLLLNHQHRGICRHFSRYSMYFPQESGISFLYVQMWLICLNVSMLSCWINRSYKREGCVYSQNNRNCRCFIFPVCAIPVCAPSCISYVRQQSIGHSLQAAGVGFQTSCVFMDSHI
jgi:hypothetical protein